MFTVHVNAPYKFHNWFNDLYHPGKVQLFNMKLIQSIFRCPFKEIYLLYIKCTTMTYHIKTRKSRKETSLLINRSKVWLHTVIFFSLLKICPILCKKKHIKSTRNYGHLNKICASHFWYLFIYLRCNILPIHSFTHDFLTLDTKRFIAMCRFITSKTREERTIRFFFVRSFHQHNFHDSECSLIYERFVW